MRYLRGVFYVALGAALIMAAKSKYKSSNFKLKKKNIKDKLVEKMEYMANLMK